MNINFLLYLWCSVLSCQSQAVYGSLGASAHHRDRSMQLMQSLWCTALSLCSACGGMHRTVFLSKF